MRITVVTHTLSNGEGLPSVEGDGPVDGVRRPKEEFNCQINSLGPGNGSGERFLQ